MKKRTDIFFFFFFTSLNFVFGQNNLQHFEARVFAAHRKTYAFFLQMVFFLSVVCEEFTSTYVFKIISYEICSSLLLTVFIWLLK